eukprot:870586_1
MPARPMNLPSYHIHRTDSEAQLFEDMAVAEYRDRCMFHRLITGIRSQQSNSNQQQQQSNNGQYSGHAHTSERRTGTKAVPIPLPFPPLPNADIV